MFFVIDDRTATPQEIQPYEAVDFRHLWNILAGRSDMVRICASNTNLCHQNGGNTNGAIGGNDSDFTKLRV